jgi:hypothetical protein
MKLRTSRARNGAAALALVATVFIASCDERLRDVTGPSPDLVPTFDSVNSEVFLSTDLAGRTACVNCHTNVGRAPAGNLNMAGDAYAAIVNVASRQRPDLLIVTPGDPESSYLIHKMEGRTGIVGREMPFNGPPYLTEGQIRVVKRWIELGAPR